MKSSVNVKLISSGLRFGLFLFLFGSLFLFTQCSGCGGENESDATTQVEDAAEEDAVAAEKKKNKKKKEADPEKGGTQSVEEGVEDVGAGDMAPVDEEADEPERTEPYVNADEWPYFGDCANMDGTVEEKKACSDKAFLAAVQDELQYPALANDEQIEGQVLISAVIGKDGNIESMNIVRDVGYGTGEEAMRAIEAVSNWTPAMHDGKVVRFQLNLPVIFVLE